MSSRARAKGRFGRTLYFRFALLFFVTMIVTSGVLFAGTFVTLYRSMQKEDTAYSQRRLLAYWARYQAEGITGLIDSLRAESLIYDERPFFVRVATEDNRTVFLSYPEHWEGFAIQESLEGAGEESPSILLRSEEQGFNLEVARISLDEQYQIQVGMSSERREAFLRLYQRNFFIFLVFVLFFGLAAGLFIAGRAVTPLRRLSAALSGIIATGDLSARLPVRGAGDELDELMVLFNRLMERIEGLISRMRHTLDTVAHDLRTPLTRLRGGAELALQSKDPERRSAALSDALEESDQILTLLTALMDISEAESGILKLKLKLIEPRPLVDQVRELYQFIGDERGIKIQIDGEFPARLYADEVRFRQVVGNLLDNAVKYSPDNGLVEIQGALADHTNFVLSLCNQGPPIPHGELPLIWDRLFRASGNTAPGMGLGLSLVKAVVESHNGTVAAENLSSGGVRFSVSFPV